MTRTERKIEAALEQHFRGLDFVIVHNGDCFADLYSNAATISINLTAIAQFIADEVALQEVGG